MQNMTNYSMEELLPIVSELAGKFTSYESTSITYEKAEQLMEAILYCLNEYEMSAGNSLRDRTIAAKEAYTLGYRLVVAKVTELREMYNELILSFQSYRNKCLKDTVIHGLPEFFKWYDARYAPQDSILTLDYPILKDLSKTNGIDKVLEYVKCIVLEQEFLKPFPNEYLSELFLSYHEDYEDLIENLCSIVLPNVIGHILLKKPINQSGFISSEYEFLIDKLQAVSEQNLEDILAGSVQEMINRLYDQNQHLSEYFSNEVHNLTIRIATAMSNGCLNRIFVL